MGELFPICIGVLLGLAFAAEARMLRLFWVRATVVLLAGVAATVLSGEYVENWGFALVDVGEVALAAWVTATFARYAAGRIRHSRTARRKTAG